jgi:hypothetical protein
MIHIKHLGPEHIGRWVEYHRGAGEIETGRIKSWTDRAVFVVYSCYGEASVLGIHGSGNQSARFNLSLTMGFRRRLPIDEGCHLGGMAGKPGMTYSLEKASRFRLAVLQSKE